MWLISDIKTKLQQRKAKREQETPTDRATRVTASATLWMAFFTFVLAFVGIVTLIEIIQGGGDTHDLAVAAKKQADVAEAAARPYIGEGGVHIVYLSGPKANGEKMQRLVRPSGRN